MKTKSKIYFGNWRWRVSVTWMKSSTFINSICLSKARLPN